MSRQLPTRPSLEHLRKQAKELLQDLRRQDPSAQLADAQQDVARDYGFASWPMLKSHVEGQEAARAEALSPFVGEWKANVAGSKRHPANEFQSATIAFEVSGADVRITDAVVDATGREERHVNSIRADGQEHVAASGNGYSLTATWLDRHTLETVGRKGGQVIGSARYTVSADGRILTISAD